MDMTLLAQMLSLALPAAWLTVGVRDNILHPSVNETLTAQVFTMARIEADYPDEYARLAHRRISNRRLHKAAFRLIILAEVATVLVMWAGVALLCLSLFGDMTVSTARDVAMIGTLMFTTIWAAFTIVGNHFSYWLCHESAQNTHFQLLLWGFANLIFLNL